MLVRRKQVVSISTAKHARWFFEAYDALKVDKNAIACGWRKMGIDSLFCNTVVVDIMYSQLRIIRTAGET